MKTNNGSMAGGVWMLVSLVVMLTIPMVIGHFSLEKSPQVTVQADASIAQ
jgi:hypothetical protein